jgi:hypothetical protein
MVHRALARQAPENTSPAITMCIADELEWVEIDVRLSKDGIHVLAHDDQLDGKTNGRGRVSDSTVEQLHALDAGSWFARRYANTRLLTLAQALEIAKGRINLYLDRKQADAEKLVADVRAAGMTRKEMAGIAWFSIAGSALKPVRGDCHTMRFSFLPASSSRGLNQPSAARPRDTACERWWDGRGSLLTWLKVDCCVIMSRMATSVLDRVKHVCPNDRLATCSLRAG